MEKSLTQSRSSIGIVGGGKAGLRLLELFSQSQFTQVSYVVDIDPQAPAVAAARLGKVPTFTQFSQAWNSVPVDFIFEVTRSAEVAAEIQRRVAGSSTILVTGATARVMLDVIEEKNRLEKKAVAHEVAEIKTQIANSLNGIETMTGDIEGVTSDMRMLAINARIEAARAGEDGRGFAVVADEMGRSVDAIRQMTQEISNVNATIKTASDRIDTALKKLEK